MSLTKEQILQPRRLEVREVDVPEWGEGATVHIRELTGNERDVYEGAMVGVEEDEDDPDAIPGGSFRGLRAKLVALAMCNAEGESFGFTPAEVEQLGNKGSAVLDRLFKVAQSLSGFDVKESEGN